MRHKRRMRAILGTFVEIAVNPHPQEDSIINFAFAEMQLVHDLMSFHDSNSELSMLNQNQGRRVSLSKHTHRVLMLAQEMMHKSNGLFNCMVGGALVKRNALPQHNPAQALEQGNVDDLVLDETGATLKRNALVTLDGIAKGYAVDLAIEAMQAKGALSGWVNAGGDIRVFGNISLPVQIRNEQQALGEVIQIKNTALATSSVSAHYDKRFPGLIYHRELTPQIGTWSIIAHKAWLADALTKVASLANAELRASIIQSLGGKCLNSANIKI
ncbi:MAG: FAD:protein FMN transferase [Methylophilus sp.]|nr:FAD:protein FMN transferase [Methylophilus sp.]